MTGLTWYIDKTATGAGTGGTGGTSQSDKDDAFQTWAAAAVFMGIGDKRSDFFVFVSGSSSESSPYRELLTVTGGAGTPGNPYNIRSEIPGEKTVFFNSIGLQQQISENNWEVTASAGGTNEFYITGPAGADPSIASPPSITVDGYYQAGSGGEPDGSRTIGTPGSLTTDKFSGYGENLADSLGFDTVYFRYDSGTAANAVIEMSLTGETFNSNLPAYNIDDIIIGYGNAAMVPKGNPTVFKRCAEIYQDFRGSTHNNSSDITYIACIGFWAGHSFGQSTNNSPNVRYFNCTDYSAHLFYLFDTAADGGLVEIINTIGDGQVAGIIDKKIDSPTLTHTSNHWSPRMVQGGGDLLYNTKEWAAAASKVVGDKVIPTTPNGFYYIATSVVSPPGDTGALEPNFPVTRGLTVVDNEVTWTAEDLFIITDVTESPSLSGTTLNTEAGQTSGAGRVNYPTMVEPLFSNIEDDFFASDLSLMQDSTAATGGEDWWTSRSITQPLDYFGNAIPDLFNIPKGALFILGTDVAPILVTPYPDLINLDADVVSVNLNTNITGETTLTVTFDPAIPNGLSETGGIVSGTVTTPTGTAIATVVGTNSFGKVTDTFQWITLTAGSGTTTINRPINSTIN